MYKLVSESRLFLNRVWLGASSKVLTKTTFHISYCYKNYIHYTLLSQQLHSLHVNVATVIFITRYCCNNYIHYTLLLQKLHSLHVTVATVTFITRYCRKNYIQYSYCRNNYIHYMLLSQQLYSLHVTVATITFITRYCRYNYVHYSQRSLIKSHIRYCINSYTKCTSMCRYYKLKKGYGNKIK
jgi:hypothetical protein